MATGSAAAGSLLVDLLHRWAERAELHSAVRDTCSLVGLAKIKQN